MYVQRKNPYARPKTRFTTQGISAPSKKELDQPFWLDALDYIARPGRAITGTIANLTDDDASTSGWEGFVGGITGAEKKDFDQILNNLGWKQNTASQGYNFFKGQEGALDLFDLVSFGGDVISDPLTYLTFGGSSAAKAGARAMAKEARNQAAKYGVNLRGSSVFKTSAGRMTNSASELIEQALIKQGKTAEEAAEIAKFADDAIENAGRKARFEGQNARINFDLPFTNITKSFGKKGKLTEIKDATISPEQALGVLNMFNKIGEEAATPDAIKDILKTKYGKTDVKELTEQELTDLQRLADLDYSNKLIKTKATEKSSKKVVAEDLERVLKIINPQSTINAQQLATTLKKKDMFQQLSDALTTINNQRKANNTLSKEALEKLGQTRFQQDMGGTSKLGDIFRPLNPFNKRVVFGNKSRQLNRAAENKTETDNAILSQTRQIEKDMETLQQMAKGLDKKELEAIGFIIEKQFPKQYGNLTNYLTKTVGNANNQKKLEDIAEFIKSRTQNYAKKEVSAGLRSKNIENYFPHIQDFDAMERVNVRKGIKENLDDPNIGKFIQQSSQNPYANNRKSFETLAEVDDTIAKLNNDLGQLRTGTAEYDKVFSQIQLLNTLFKRDPIKVFEQRAKTAVRSSAMKELQKQYELDGLIIRNAQMVKKGGKSSVPEDLLEKGYRKLSNKEADAIGLLNVLGRNANETILMNEDLYKMLTESTKLSEKEAVNRTLEMVNVVTNGFKTIYTSVVPKHYWYNLVGSVFNNSMAGVGVSSYYKSISLLKKLKNGTLSDKEKKIIERALDSGVLNQTAFADLVRPEILVKGRDKNLRERELEFYRKIDAANQAIVDNPVSKKFRRYLGDPIDNFTRLAHYIDVLEKTKSTKLASESVRKHLFNYNEVTPTDRTIKVFLPFWNWMKNNVPLQIEKLATEPRIAQTYAQLREESFGNQESADFPDYIQEGFLKLPFAENSFYNPRLPLQDLGQITDPAKTMFNALSPVFKIPTELTTNYQFFSERPVSYRALYDDGTNYFNKDKSLSEFGQYVNANAGILGDLYDAGVGITSGEKPALEIFLNNLFGSTSSPRKE